MEVKKDSGGPFQIRRRFSSLCTRSLRSSSLVRSTVPQYLRNLLITFPLLSFQSFLSPKLNSVSSSFPLSFPTCLGQEFPYNRENVKKRPRNFNSIFSPALANCCKGTSVSASLEEGERKEKGGRKKLGMWRKTGDSFGDVAFPPPRHGRHTKASLLTNLRSLVPNAERHSTSFNY